MLQHVAGGYCQRILVIRVDGSILQSYAVGIELFFLDAIGKQVDGKACRAFTGRESHAFRNLETIGIEIGRHKAHGGFLLRILTGYNHAERIACSFACRQDIFGIIGHKRCLDAITAYRTGRIILCLFGTCAESQRQYQG